MAFQGRFQFRVWFRAWALQLAWTATTWACTREWFGESPIREGWKAETEQAGQGRCPSPSHLGSHWPDLYQCNACCAWRVGCREHDACPMGPATRAAGASGHHGRVDWRFRTHQSGQTVAALDQQTEAVRGKNAPASSGACCRRGQVGCLSIAASRSFCETASPILRRQGSFTSGYPGCDLGGAIFERCLGEACWSVGGQRSDLHGLHGSSFRVCRFAKLVDEFWGRCRCCRRLGNLFGFSRCHGPSQGGTFAVFRFSATGKSYSLASRRAQWCFAPFSSARRLCESPICSSHFRCDVSVWHKPCTVVSICWRAFTRGPVGCPCVACSLSYFALRGASCPCAAISSACGGTSAAFFLCKGCIAGPGWRSCYAGQARLQLPAAAGPWSVSSCPCPRRQGEGFIPDLCHSKASAQRRITSSWEGWRGEKGNGSSRPKAPWTMSSADQESPSSQSCRSRMLRLPWAPGQTGCQTSSNCSAACFRHRPPASRRSAVPHHPRRRRRSFHDVLSHSGVCESLLGWPFEHCQSLIACLRGPVTFRGCFYELGLPTPVWIDLVLVPDGVSTAVGLDSCADFWLAALSRALFAFDGRLQRCMLPRIVRFFSAVGLNLRVGLPGHDVTWVWPVVCPGCPGVFADLTWFFSRLWQDTACLLLFCPPLRGVAWCVSVCLGCLCS